MKAILLLQKEEEEKYVCFRKQPATAKLFP
jgi:hypothetical protein